MNNNYTLTTELSRIIAMVIMSRFKFFVQNNKNTCNYQLL
jgi:hypothetical protein